MIVYRFVCLFVCLEALKEHRPPWLRQIITQILADTRVNHTGVLAVGNYLGFSLAVGIFTFVVNSLYGFNYVKINL